jgi:hypothetical protein
MNYLYEAIKPTRLYIKQCPHCGLKYFGKHTGQNIEKYPGSGVRWNNHLNYHEVEPVHLWNSDWYYDTSISRFALKFSCMNKIVESDIWANLKPENGLDGGWDYVNNSDIDKFKGKRHTDETKNLLRDISSARVHSELTKIKISENNYRTNVSRGIKVSNALRGVPKSKNHKNKLSESLSDPEKKDSNGKSYKRPRRKNEFIWITDGNVSTRIRKDSNIPEGWKRGQTINKVWITDGIIEKRIGNDYVIPEGWHYGRKPKVK